MLLLPKNGLDNPISAENRRTTQFTHTPDSTIAHLLARLARILLRLNVAEKPEEMNDPGFRLYLLRGNLAEYWSLRFSGNWRIVFRFHDGEAVDVDLIDYH